MSTSPESQIPLVLFKAGMEPTANTVSPSSSCASGSTRVSCPDRDSVDPTPKANIGIPASAIAAEATVKPADRTLGSMSDSRMRRWTSRADLGKRCLSKSRYLGQAGTTVSVYDFSSATGYYVCYNGTGIREGALDGTRRGHGCASAYRDAVATVRKTRAACSQRPSRARHAVRTA